MADDRSKEMEAKREQIDRILQGLLERFPEEASKLTQAEKVVSEVTEDKSDQKLEEAVTKAEQVEATEVKSEELDVALIPTGDSPLDAQFHQFEEQLISMVDGLSFKHRFFGGFAPDDVTNKLKELLLKIREAAEELNSVHLSQRKEVLAELLHKNEELQQLQLVQAETVAQKNALTEEKGVLQVEQAKLKAEHQEKLASLQKKIDEQNEELISLKQQQDTMEQAHQLLAEARAEAELIKAEAKKQAEQLLQRVQQEADERILLNRVQIRSEQAEAEQKHNLLIAEVKELAEKRDALKHQLQSYRQILERVEQQIKQLGNLL